MRVLNRILKWTSEGIGYEADPIHVEIIPKLFDIDNCKVATIPGTKQECHAKTGDTEESRDDENSSNEKHSIYRAPVARANHFAPDRPDIPFVATELAMSMSSPTRGDWERLKRLARYLKGTPRDVKKFA